MGWQGFLSFFLSFEVEMVQKCFQELGEGVLIVLTDELVLFGVEVIGRGLDMVCLIALQQLMKLAFGGDSVGIGIVVHSLFGVGPVFGEPVPPVEVVGL